MFKGNRKYYWILGSIFTLIVVIQYLQPKPVNWARTYMRKDKIPFGCYAIYNLLDTWAKDVQINRQSVYELGSNNNSENNALVVINDRVTISGLELKSLLDFIHDGNSVFIAANDFEGGLKDTCHLDVDYQWFSYGAGMDSLLKKDAFKLRMPDRGNVRAYAYSQAAVESYFTRFDSASFRIISMDERNRPVVISRKFGKGKLYLCSVPDVFSNIFIVNHENRFYAYSLMSLVASSKTIIWDEYFKTYNVQNDTIFRFIFSNEALYSAYLLLLLSLIVFVVFSIKRKQRPVEIVVPPSNSTLEFVDVISNVYFNSGNHKNIAGEKINYFYFDVRNKFQVTTDKLDEEFFERISRLSGIAKEEITGLFRYCETMRKAERLSENDLLDLSKRINNFKQKSIR